MLLTIQDANVWMKRSLTYMPSCCKHATNNKNNYIYLGFTILLISRTKIKDCNRKILDVFIT